MAHKISLVWCLKMLNDSIAPIFSFIIIFFLSTTSSFAATPAFPGAQGFGMYTPGGRGGRIIEVTNLNDSGSGSFRQAVVVEKGPRIVVFKIGGIINLKSNIEIKEPYLTVAGQTAPGEGIVLVGSRLGVRTHDVIIRGMKVRPGDAPGGDMGSRDGISVTTDPNTKKEVYNVIIDHNSISWALDENVAIWDNTFGLSGVKLHDITYSYNIVSEALRCRVLATSDTNGRNCSRNGKEPYDRRVSGFGALIGEDVKNISFHHNLLASNDYRNPIITQGVSLEFINNVIYNYGLGSMEIPVGGNNGPENPNFVNIIGNYFKPTSATGKDDTIDGTVKTIKGIRLHCRMPKGSRIFIKGNLDTIYHPDDLKGDQLDVVSLDNTCKSYLMEMISNSSALSVTGGVTTTSAAKAFTEVLANAGARTQGLDLVDSRAVNTTEGGISPVAKQIVSGPGNRNNWFIDTPDEAGTNPVYATTHSKLVDEDHDGMPDNWESARGGNLNPSSLGPNGYTWIEEYINSFLVKQGDFNSDGKVDLYDYNILVAGFGNPYGIVDYNNLVSNYEK